MTQPHGHEGGEWLDREQKYPRWKERIKRRIVTVSYAGIIDAAIPHLSDQPPHTLLKTDLWADSLGDPTVRLNGRFQIYGVDLSARVCKAAHQNGNRKGLAVARSDILHLPYADGTFSMIADISTLDHIQPPNVPRVIGEYKRVLKPAGILLLCVDQRLSLAWELYRKSLPYRAWSWLPSQLRRLIEDSGLETLESRYTNTPLDLISRRIRLRAPAQLLAPMAQYYTISARKPK
jgi:SAM-dependent methyltransferase